MSPGTIGGGRCVCRCSSVPYSAKRDRALKGPRRGADDGTRGPASPLRRSALRRLTARRRRIASARWERSSPWRPCGRALFLFRPNVFCRLAVGDLLVFRREGAHGGWQFSSSQGRISARNWGAAGIGVSSSVSSPEGDHILRDGQVPVGVRPALYATTAVRERAIQCHPTTRKAISTGGTTVRFNTSHPNICCTAPDVTAVTATLPNTMKS